MCGIVGYIQTKPDADKEKKYLKVFTELLIHDTIRGMDSTGLAVIPLDKSKEIMIEKRALAGFDFVGTEEYHRATGYMETTPSLVIGHNRAATRGAINDANAHPFKYDHITLVHNGGITNFKELDSGSTSDVDSAHVAAAIAKYGYAHTLPKLDGYAILVWHDARDHTIHFARTNNRALCWMWDEFDTLWYASEHKMLEWVCHRNNLQLVGTMHAPREHYHYWSDVNNLKEFKKESFPVYLPPEKKGSSTNLDQWRNRSQGGQSLGEAHSGSGGNKPATNSSCTGKHSHGNHQQTSCAGSTAQGTTGTRPSISNNSTAPTLYYDAEHDTYKQTVEQSRARYEPIAERKLNRLQRHLSKYNLRMGEIIDVTPYAFQNEHKGELVTISASYKPQTTNTWPSGSKAMEVRIYDTTEKFFYNRDPYGRLRVRIASIIDLLDKGEKFEVLVCAPTVQLAKEMCIGPNGTHIPKDVFREIANLGCLHCKGQILTLDQRDVTWEGYTSNPRIVCPSCSGAMTRLAK